MPTYAVTYLGLAAADGFRATLTAGALLFVLTPFAGLAADRLGRIAVPMPFALLLALVPVPLFAWMTIQPSALALLMSQALLAALLAGYLGALPSLLTELFPVRNRSTGISLSYNLSVALFGGLAPLTITWLISVTGSRAAPGYYVSLAGACSFASLVMAQRLSRQPS